MISSPAASPDPPLPFDTAAFELLDVAVAWADAGGRLLGANAAFGAAIGQPVDAARGQPVAALLALDDAAAIAALACGSGLAARRVAARGTSGGAIQARLAVRRQGALQLLSWQPLPDSALETGWLAERLALVQRLGQLGIWERDVRTLSGRWDRQVWQFWGVAPQDGAPDLELASRAVHPDDQSALVAEFNRSLRQVGEYAHRYRVIGEDGQLRHLRSVWQVLPGADGRPERVFGVMLDDTETYRSAQRFDEASAPLRLAVALADIAIWRHERGADKVHLNAPGWALLGRQAQADGMPLADLAVLVHPDDLPLALQHIDQPPAALAEGGAIDLVLRLRHSDGHWRHVLTRRVARRNAAGAVLDQLGVALDLSERFDQQQRALDLARRLEMATAAAGVGVWSTSLGESPQPHWDDQMRVLHGLAADHPAPRLRRYLARHVHRADRRSLADGLALLLRRGAGMLDLDLRIVCPDGGTRRMASRSSLETDADGQRHLYGVMLDVTERHAAEQRLRAADERAALAARGAGIGTWESDAEARAGWWDAQMYQLRGLAPRSTPMPVDESLALVHVDDRAGAEAEIAAALAEDRPSNGEFRVRWPDGTVRWLASRSTPVRDEGGRTVRRIGINWDITDARNAATAREARLIAQRENQAKSRLLARISHELRTPLNAVLGFSQLLLAGSEPPEPQVWRRQVGHVRAAGEHLLALIDDVLELSSLDSGELPMRLQSVEVAPLVATTLPLVERLAREHRVSVAPGSLAGWALADPVRLRQVLVNLLSNGIKYNRPGGCVTIAASREGRQLVLAVQDTGPGIDEAQLDHLFEPFNRLGLEQGGIAGTGIGLAIVKAAVQQMGGTVQVRSRRGEGSCFEVRLPCADAATAPAATAAAKLPLPLAAPGRSGRLLYIEDNEVNLMIVAELVRQRHDLELITAVDGAAGLAAARAQRPALILLDMQLPDIDGLEVLRRLRAEPDTAGIRCIAVSANAMPDDVRRARAAGFDDYWTKPLDLAAFMRQLDALFGPVGTPRAHRSADLGAGGALP